MCYHFSSAKEGPGDQLNGALVPHHTPLVLSAALMAAVCSKKANHPSLPAAPDLCPSRQLGNCDWSRMQQPGYSSGH